MGVMLPPSPAWILHGNSLMALWEQTHFYCLGGWAGCIQKCGKPCVPVAPSPRERRACDWGTLSLVQGASCGSWRQGSVLPGAAGPTGGNQHQLTAAQPSRGTVPGSPRQFNTGNSELINTISNVSGYKRETDLIFTAKNTHWCIFIKSGE